MRKGRVVALAASLTVGAAVLGFSVGSVGRPSYRRQLSIVWDQPVAHDRDSLTGEIAGSKSFGQTFRATQRNMGRIDVFLSNFRMPNASPVLLNVREIGSEEVLRRSVAPSGSVDDNRYHPFSFRPIRDSANRNFEVVVSSPRAEQGHTVTGWLSDRDQYSAGWASINNEPDYQRDLVMRVGYRTRIEGVIDELVHRGSQYKPGYLKGATLRVIVILAFIVTLTTLYGVAISALGGGPPARSDP
ncbi:MAG TPA: hypothetical protein VE915_08140 [Actinomycetota bacterium]|jgi:hypothetical protein|nr:hypothetical protein [Actinomycetota bacterium]